MMAMPLFHLVEASNWDFSSPGSSGNRYLGIWYMKISTGTVNPIAQLLDSGNLVVRDANDVNPDNFLWQSFDYPSYTLLPGMKLGRNSATGLDWYISSWKSNDDPSPGDFTHRCNPQGYRQLFMRNGSALRFCSGPWNGLCFTGTPNLKPNSIFNLGFFFNKQEVYISYELLNSSVVSRLMLSLDGHLQRWTWVDRTQKWVLYLSVPIDNCDIYGTCGPYGCCNINNSPVCGCLRKFVPKYPKDWETTDWSGGCVRQIPLDCQSGDGFLKYSDEEEVGACYGLMTREFPGLGQDLYIRMASSELGGVGYIWKKRKWTTISSVVSTGTIMLGLVVTLYVWKKKWQQKRKDIA
ncbi:hypothetical protein F0562_010216 [Nyssa sinensis]|uniref:Bulb-type lectin domain-containing protein n=1 Tax=Nyssa sinensis TaxID=561372 RepID=A0A5J4ZY86_9ASTE|nr:hypothetical protein F0562_010216 [Nyssa sinensis]